MRRSLFTLLGAILASTTAGAADMGGYPVKAPPASIVAPYDYFNGFYIGGHTGVGVDRGAGTAFDPFGSLGFNTAPFGFIGGLHAGVGTRLNGNFYLGIEGDGDVATLDGTVNNPGFIGDVSSKNRWLTSIRGRFGFVLAPNLMAYGTAGWGWAGSSFTVTGIDGSQFSTSPTLNGVVAGGGLEYAFSSSWGLRAQYLHYFLGDLHTGVAVGNSLVPIGASVTHNVAAATIGLSYKFAP